MQLKQRKSNPPSFAEFLLLLRTEEDREAAKSHRMKQHLGARPKVGAHSQLVPPEKNLCTVLSNLTKQLSEQMTIQQQLAMITASQTRHTPATKMRHLPATFVSKRTETRKPTEQYVQSLKARLQESYRIASENAAKAAEKNKIRVDRKVLPSKLEVGDRVLLHNLRLRGKHKLSDKWEQTIYTVVNQAGNLPFYTVKPEQHDGPVRTLHRHLLLPCGFLPGVDDNPVHEASPVSRPKTRQQC